MNGTMPVDEQTTVRPVERINNLKHNLRRSKSAGVALLLVASGAMGYLGGYAETKHQTQVSGQTAVRQQVVSSESELISDLATKVSESVVSVDVTSQGTSNSFFDFGQSIEQASAGTGFIISSDGYILTNRHVVPTGTTSVSVTLSDGTKLDGVEVVGRTNSSDPLDVAFLKVKDAKGKKLTPIALGDSSKIKVGDKVVAIGNALGQFQNTVTSGIISGYGRSVQAGVSNGNSETLQNLFQTDAAINAGNSGGPLLNMSGEVIGINTAIAGSAQSIGFAIPVNDVQGLIKSVLASGKLLRPYLGVRYISLTDDVAYELNLSTKRGAYIAPSTNGQTPILKDSPAEKAGLKEKDIISKIDGVNVDEKNSLTSIIGKHSVGDEVTLTIIRDGGKEQDIKVKLEAAPTS